MANEHLPAYDDHPAMFRNHPLGYIGVWVLILAPVLALLMYRKEIAEMGDFPPAMLLAATCGPTWRHHRVSNRGVPDSRRRGRSSGSAVVAR